MVNRQGLEFDGSGNLFQSTGLYGQSKIQKFKFPSIEKVSARELSSKAFGEGLTILNDKIYQLTWLEREVYVYDKDFALLETFNLPNDIEEGWGICNDGKNLYISSGSHRVYKLDPNSFSILSSIEVINDNKEINRLNELEWVDGEIWANIYYSKYIIRINPDSGQVLGWINLTGLEKSESKSWYAGYVLNGIAVYDNRIFVTGKGWNTMYEIQLIFDYESLKNPKLR